MATLVVSLWNFFRTGKFSHECSNALLTPNLDNIEKRLVSIEDFLAKYGYSPTHELGGSEDGNTHAN